MTFNFSKVRWFHYHNFRFFEASFKLATNATLHLHDKTADTTKLRQFEVKQVLCRKPSKTPGGSRDLKIIGHVIADTKAQAHTGTGQA